MKAGRPIVKEEDRLSSRVTINITLQEQIALQQLADKDRRSLPAWCRIQLTKLIKGTNNEI